MKDCTMFATTTANGFIADDMYKKDFFISSLIINIFLLIALLFILVK